MGGFDTLAVVSDISALFLDTLPPIDQPIHQALRFCLSVLLSFPPKAAAYRFTCS